uniref:Uncharacterized protein n=1 Tax=Avena sativa TaxID=4498 RepID=A0ACD5V7P1_AVESA
MNFFVFLSPNRSQGVYFYLPFPPSNPTPLVSSPPANSSPCFFKPFGAFIWAPSPPPFLLSPCCTYNICCRLLGRVDYEIKVNSLQRMASPAAADSGASGLRRSASARLAPNPSPLGGNASSSRPQPPRSTTSTGPAYPRHAQKAPSISCKAATSTDTPPATPRGLTKQPSSASSSSRYASMFSPRKLMQRASRAFRGSGRSRRKKNADAAAEAAVDGGEVDSPSSVVSKGSDAESVFSLDDQITADGAAAAKQQEEEVVPEKIIHEANPTPAPVAFEEKEEERKDTPEKEAPAAVEEEAEPKKEPVPLPPAPEVVTVDEITAAKEAVKEKEKEQREMEIKAEVVKRFQGRRVRTTSMEKRELARSNEAIEEARTKLLELRQGNRVKALVGAFETVMDDNQRRAATGKPQLNLRV